MRKLVIIGASGHGKVVADIAVRNGYDEIVFLDDNESVKECSDYPVVGKSEEAVYQKCDVIVAIGDASIRQRIQKKLEYVGVQIATLIHPDAVIAEFVKIGIGTVVMAGAVINPETTIGKGCIINTCSSVDHDCVIGDYVHISIGAHVAGTVNVGERTWIGAGVTVSNNVSICGDCMIGAGAVVIRNISKAGIYLGVPAEEKNMAKENGLGGG
ncbi:acetyltransferase [Roseburia hominis]